MLFAMLVIEVFPQGAAACGQQLAVKVFDGLLHVAGGIISPVGSAVALEAPALADVEQGAAEMVQRDLVVKGFGAQFIRIGTLKLLAGLLVGGHQA